MDDSNDEQKEFGEIIYFFYQMQRHSLTFDEFFRLSEDWRRVSEGYNNIVINHAFRTYANSFDDLPTPMALANILRNIKDYGVSACLN